MESRNTLDIQNLRYVIEYGQLSEDALALRKQIFVQETGYLTDNQLITDEDRNGFNISIYYQDQIIGSISGVNAEQSKLSERSGIPNTALKNTLYLSRGMVVPQFRGRNIFYLMLYLCAQQATYRERGNIVIYKHSQDSALDKVLNFQIMENLKPLEFSGKGNAYTLTPIYCATDYLRYGCWRHLNSNLQGFVKQFFAEEIRQIVLKLTDRFYENPWIQAVYKGTLTRNQYIDSLANNYQFVRWTTRLLARVVGITDNEELRNHYLDHLQGEINHEKIVERDLLAMGADLDFVKNNKLPNININKFMCVQESMAAFYNDPVLFLAVPLSIESVTAHLSDEFLKALEKCIAGWGIKKPLDAMRYLSSHVHTDGDPDGHWDQTILSVQKFLKDEYQTRRFINVAHMVLESFTDGYIDIMKYPDLTAIKPSAILSKEEAAT